MATRYAYGAKQDRPARWAKEHADAGLVDTILAQRMAWDDDLARKGECLIREQDVMLFDPHVRARRRAGTVCRRQLELIFGNPFVSGFVGQAQDVDKALQKMLGMCSNRRLQTYITPELWMAQAQETARGLGGNLVYWGLEKAVYRFEDGSRYECHKE